MFIKALFDNIMLEHEVIRTLKKKKGASSFMAIKLDVRIFYNSWMGLPHRHSRKLLLLRKWRNRIKQSVSTAYFSFKLSSSPMDFITPKWRTDKATPSSHSTYLCWVLLYDLYRGEPVEDIHGLKSVALMALFLTSSLWMKLCVMSGQPDKRP